MVVLSFMKFQKTEEIKKISFILSAILGLSACGVGLNNVIQIYHAKPFLLSFALGDI